MPSQHVADDELTRLLAGDLSRFHAARVRRHLTECSICREKQTAIVGIWQSAQTLRETQTPDVLWARISHATIESPASPERKTRMPYFALRPALGAAAAVTGIAALAGGALLYAPLALHAPRALAFSDVEEAMRDVKVVSWSVSRYIPNAKTGDWSATEGSSAWVRLDPPAQLSKTTGYAGKPEGLYFLTTERGVLSFTPGQKDYFLFDSGYKTMRTKSQMQKDFQQMLVFTREKSTQTTQNRKDSLPWKWRETPWKGEKATLNGKPVLRFSRHSVRYRDDSNFWKKQIPQEYDATIYADPETYRIVRREDEQTKGVPGRSRTVSENFQYHETAPVGTFEAAPRAGETVILTDWTKTGLRAPVNAADRKAAEDVIRRLAEARNRNDWNAFTALRDFSYEPTRQQLDRVGRDVSKLPAKYRGNLDKPAMTEAEYRAKVETGFRQNLPYSRWNITKIIHTGYAWNYLYTQPSETSVFPPTTPPDLFEVSTTVKGTQANGKTKVQMAAFTLHKSPTGFSVTSVAFRDFPKPRSNSLSPYEDGARAAMGGAPKPKVKPSGKGPRRAGRR